MIHSRSHEPLAALLLISDLEQAIAQRTDMFSHSLRLAIKEGKPATLILQMIADQAGDNRVAVAGIIGGTLTQKIVDYVNRS